jgi:hypothetical protein
VKSLKLKVRTSHGRGLEKHLDTPVPNGDFLLLHHFGIALLISGIISYHLRKYHLKTYDTKILILGKEEVIGAS